MPDQELPLGFAMALAKNEAAMEAFAALPQDRKDAVLQRAHAARSRREMEQLAAQLTKGLTG